MMSFRLKQVGFALCLAASLLVGSVSACMCSHHEEKPKSSETSCHGPHEDQAENTESTVTENAFDVDCICFVNQPTPFIAAKWENKKLKADKSVSSSDQTVPHSLFVTAIAINLPPPEFDRDLSYSHVLKSLLPSRAPPRL